MRTTRRQFLVGGAAVLGAAATAGFPAARAIAAPRWKPFVDDYGIDVPILGAGMAFVAVPRLAAAISNAGGLGTVGASPLPPPAVDDLIAQTRALTDRPFGVNLIVANGFPGASVPFTTDDHVAVCASNRVPVVSFHWDLPPARWVKQLHAAESKVWMQVGSVADAVRAEHLGVDAIIVQGTNAGGHAKGVDRLDVLLRAVRNAVATPLLAAGGVATHHDVQAALGLGAQAVWVGTRFVATDEAYAHDKYKQRILSSDGSDTVRTTMFGPEWSGATLRVLRNRVVDEWAGRESDIPMPPPPPAFIGRTTFAGTPYLMPKFSALLPTPDTKGDFEEMAFAAGGDAARSITSVESAAAVVRDLSRAL